LSESCFDPRGSVSFGIKEHIEIPGIRYDPAIGIFGMNVSVLLERAGYRVSRRNRRASRVGRGQVVSREESMEFFRHNFGVTVE
jgi:large subunit ribosomal protein L5